jgi:hypothetical protein
MGDYRYIDRYSRATSAESAEGALLCGVGWDGEDYADWRVGP